MRVLITGVTGLVGGALAPALAEDGHEVFAVARGAQPEQPGISWIEADLGAPLPPDVLPGRLDAVVHLAQSARHRDFPDGAPDMFAVNVASTAALLEHARSAGASRFVYASSGGVYGSGPEPFAEDAPLRPPNFYIATKASGEHLVGAYAGELAASSVRFFFVYGPRQAGMLVPNLADRVLAGDEVTVQGDPGLRINPIHVDDAVRALQALLERDAGLTVNVGGDEIVDIGGLSRRLAERAGVEARIRHVDASAPGDLVGDVRRMHDELGVTPRVGLTDGLAEVVEARRAARG